MPIQLLYNEYSQTREFIQGALSSLSFASWSRDLCCALMDGNDSVAQTINLPD